uniref:Uncharacterized protein n=1 Tax=Mesocestoides corti TaxID=53468 RepID=A0A5K3F0H1_MESCO
MPKRKSVPNKSIVSKCPKLDDTDKINHNEYKSLIQSAFLLKCPPDFFEFYNFCCSVFPESPLGLIDKRTPVCTTLNGIGLQVELRNGIGYRPVTSSHNEITEMLQNLMDSKNEKARLRNLSKLDELMTLVQFANDEGDYGQGLELGLDLLAFHPRGPLESANCLNKRIAVLLSTGYRLAGRPRFSDVIKQHMETRSTPKTVKDVTASSG